MAELAGHVAARDRRVHGGAVDRARGGRGPRSTVDRACGASAGGGGGRSAAARHGRPRRAFGGGAAGHGRTRRGRGRGRHGEASPGRGSPWRMDGWTSLTTELAAARLTAAAARELGELAARVRALRRRLGF